MASSVALGIPTHGFAPRSCATYRRAVGRCAAQPNGRLRCAALRSAAPVAAGPLRCAAKARRPRVSCAAAGDDNDKEPERDEGACAPRQTCRRAVRELMAGALDRWPVHRHVFELLSGSCTAERRCHLLRRARRLLQSGQHRSSPSPARAVRPPRAPCTPARCTRTRALALTLAASLADASATGTTARFSGVWRLSSLAIPASDVGFGGLPLVADSWRWWPQSSVYAYAVTPGKRCLAIRALQRGTRSCPSQVATVTQLEDVASPFRLQQGCCAPFWRPLHDGCCTAKLRSRHQRLRPHRAACAARCTAYARSAVRRRERPVA